MLPGFGTHQRTPAGRLQSDPEYFDWPLDVPGRRTGRRANYRDRRGLHVCPVAKFIAAAALEQEPQLRPVCPFDLFGFFNIGPEPVIAGDEFLKIVSRRGKFEGNIR
jgi:hypothetical protein